MCDYSTEGYNTRKAEVGDKLVTHRAVHGFMTQADAKRFEVMPIGKNLCLTCLWEKGIELAVTKPHWQESKKATYLRQASVAGYRDHLVWDTGAVELIAALPPGTHAEVIMIPSLKKKAETLDTKLGIDKLNARITDSPDPAAVPTVSGDGGGIIQRMLSRITG